MKCKKIILINGFWLCGLLCANAVASLPIGSAALTVQTVSAQDCAVPQQIVATGNVTARNEARIDSLSTGLPIAKIMVDIGDSVKKNQILVKFDTAGLQSGLLNAESTLNAAKADYEQAKANAAQSTALIKEGFISKKAATQTFTDAKTALEKVAAARAAVQAQKLALQQATVRAPAAGIIISKSAKLGAVMGLGQELFRMIVDGRLEWQAQVQSIDLPSIHHGDRVSITTSAGHSVTGIVRMVGPVVDASTRLGTIYVNLNKAKDHRVEAGMFAKGVFNLGEQNSIVVPEQSVVLRDGYSYVFIVGAKNQVRMVKVTAASHFSGLIQIKQGLVNQQIIVSTGAGLLNDGDLVRINNDTTAKLAFVCPKKIVTAS
jgi:HlyD family secretion protein